MKYIINKMEEFASGIRIHFEYVLSDGKKVAESINFGFLSYESGDWKYELDAFIERKITMEEKAISRKNTTQANPEDIKKIEEFKKYLGEHEIKPNTNGFISVSVGKKME